MGIKVLFTIYIPKDDVGREGGRGKGERMNSHTDYELVLRYRMCN